MPASFMKYLGIDHGASNLGLAMGDDESRLALPFDTIAEKDLEKQLDTIVQITLDEDIDAIVVGLPLNLEGKESHQAGKTISFIEELQSRTSVPVYREDERLSTKLAHTLQREGSLNDDHSLAAAAILQTYLDKQAL